MSTGAPPSKSYSWCYKMATISVVGEEVKFTLGMRPLRGYIPRSVLVEQLLEIASEHVSLGTVYADAEFDGIGVIDALEEQNLSYLIRKSLRRWEVPSIASNSSFVGASTGSFIAY